MHSFRLGRVSADPCTTATYTCAIAKLSISIQATERTPCSWLPYDGKQNTPPRYRTQPSLGAVGGGHDARLRSHQPVPEVLRRMPRLRDSSFPVPAARAGCQAHPVSRPSRHAATNHRRSKRPDRDFAERAGSLPNAACGGAATRAAYQHDVLARIDAVVVVAGLRPPVSLDRELFHPDPAGNRRVHRWGCTKRGGRGHGQERAPPEPERPASHGNAR
ncbi:hypothetical protein B0T10DRAFT_596130 [Thelonectria olida]|nr:hypothetical protein B0T10DRAFT_596130 [Thelonectria olida]